VEIRRAGDKLNLLEDKYSGLAESMNASEDAHGSVKAGETEFHNSALARYLSLLLYRADGRRDSAAIDLDQLKKAFTAQPHVYDFPLPPNLDSMVEATDMARVNIIGFAGLSPAKRASTLRLTTGDNLILITQEKEDENGQMVLTNIAPIPFPGIDGGYNFKCQLAEMLQRPSRVARMRVFVDDVPAGDLALIEKMDKVAVETFKLKESMVFLKTIIRTVTKGVLTQKAKSAADSAAENAGGNWLSVFAFIGGIVADVAVDATEEADLRSARYFPGRAYVGEFLVKPGGHELRVDYYDSAGGLIYQENFPLRDYKAGELNLLAAYNLQ
jgi:hypothetical protein